MSVDAMTPGRCYWAKTSLVLGEAKVIDEVSVDRVGY